MECICERPTWRLDGTCNKCHQPIVQKMREEAEKQSRWTTRQQSPVPGREEVLPYVLRRLPANAQQVKIGLIEREAMGKAKYGTVSQTENGRNPLIDALQEAADLVMYLAQANLESDGFALRIRAPLGAQSARLEELQRQAEQLLRELEELTR